MTTPRRRRSVGLFGSMLLAASAVLANTSIAPVSPVDAAPKPPACTLLPQLRGVTINQGVGNYNPLARGKETLVRLFLSLPSCAASGNSIAITGGTLTVLNGTATLGTITAPTAPPANPFPLLTPYASAPSKDAVSDPKYVVPGSMLAPASTTGRFTATFRAVVNYSAKTSSTATPVTGSATFTSISGSTTPITALIEQRSNALRILVVPMGDGSRTFASQFSSSATAAVQNAMATISRDWPIPAAISDLGATTSAGLRYTINPALLDIRTLLRADGKWCGSGANFDAVKGLLSQSLQSWNTANPSRTADVVLGAVDAAISGDSTQQCAEGMAGVNSQVAWIRAIPDGASPSMSGGLASMELAHTLGVVPLARDDAFNPYHSPNLQADGQAPDRAYNVTLRSFLVDDRTAMTLSSGWNNATVVYEPPDYGALLCRLGGQPTADCTATQSGGVGTSTGVAAGPHFVMSGTTDLATAAGTDVVESYFAANVAPTRPDPASQLKLIQIKPSGSTILGVPTSELVSDHDHGGVGDETTASPRRVFSVAFPFDTTTTRVELRLGGVAGTVLYSRDRPSAPPVVNSVSQSPIGAGVHNFSGDTSYDDFDPAISSDGAWIAWTVPCDKPETCGSAPSGTLRVVIAPASDVSLARDVWVIPGTDSSDYDAPALIGSDPDLKLALTIGDALYTAPVTILEGGEAEVRDTDLILRYNGAAGDAHDPSWNVDGTRVAYTVDGDVWALDDAATPSPVQLTFSGDARDPAWSHTAGDDRIAYTRSDSSITIISSSALVPSAPESTLTSAVPHGPTALEPLDAPQDYVVTNPDPLDDDGICDADCTLGDAIVASNASATDTDTIKFAIPSGGGVVTIDGATLPAITDEVLLDATTQTGYVAASGPSVPGQPVIELDGGGIAGPGLEILGSGADNTTIKGLIVNGYVGDQIAVDGASSVTIEGTWIDGGLSGGIKIAHSAEATFDVTIGGTTDAARNVILGGIEIEGSTAFAGADAGHKIQGNYIGLDPTGTSDANLFDTDGMTLRDPGLKIEITDNVISGNRVGVDAENMDEAAISGNRVGTDQSGADDVGNLVEGFKLDVDSDQNTFTSNVISGNGFAAVSLASDSSGNVFEKNLIGTDAAGTTAIANGGFGALEITGSSDTVIGSPGNGNVISGNTGNGIDLSSSSDTIIEGNMIGLGADGTTALGNGGSGVVVAGGSGTIIGGTSFGSNNYISSNGADGISLESTSATSILGNTIGASASGSLDRGNATSGIWVKSGVTGTIIGSTVAGNFIVGNGGDGILLSATTSGTTIKHNTIGQFSLPNGESGIEISDSPGNTLGGVAANEGNAIVGNTRDGVTVGGAAATDNSIRGSGTIGNGSLAADLGIDLGPDGVNLNDPGDGDVGANDLQNFPVLTAAVPSGGVSQVSGTLDTGAGTFTIDLYRVVTCDPSGNGEGQLWIGSGSTTAGAFTVAATETVPPGLHITATATSPTGDTSEFSPCFLVTAADPLIVTTTADSGPGSLRDAMDYANATSGQDTIRFDIPGSGPHTITLAGPLPEITDDVIITATGQTGWVGGGPPRVQVDGNGSFNGFRATMGAGISIEIAALSITSMTAAVMFDGPGCSLIASWIGVAPSGTADANGDGVVVLSGDARIGGLGFRSNLISGNDLSGVNSHGVDVGGGDATIVGNLIGTTSNGLSRLPNGGNGVFVRFSGSAVIGTTNIGESNTISGNNGYGIRLTTDDNRIENNFIGLGSSGTTAVPNHGGIFVEGATGTEIIGNIISGNSVAPAVPGPLDGNGILGQGAVSTLVQGNVIGLAADGIALVPNQQNGVYFANPGASNMIGGTGPSQGNIISGNGIAPITGSGIVTEITATAIIGNRIGTDATGSLDRGNLGYGINVVGILTSPTTIGGSAAGEGNVISGNGINGIQLNFSSGTTAFGNLIGTTADGNDSLPNDGYGIFLSNADGNTIGGIAAGEANTIKNNGNAGIGADAGSANNLFRGNAIDLNAGLGIDHFPFTVVDTGAPVVTSAVESGGTTIVEGTAGAAFASGTIDVYVSPACDPSLSGEGALHVASGSATLSGDFVIGAVPAVIGDWITVTASTPGENTTEFSNCVAVTAAGASADLSLTATEVSALTVTPGDDLVVDVMVTNGGPDTTPDATITATLDPELHFVANAGEYSCIEVASVLTCTTGLIPDLASVTDSIVLRATADADREVATLLSFTVAPDATVDDSNNTNDSDAVSYTVDHPCNDSDACLWVLEPSRAADPLAVPNDPPAGQPREFLLLDARAASWSDNGRIAFARGSNIWTSDSAGGDLEQVTDNVGPFDDRPAMAGSRIAFDRFRDLGDGNDTDVFIADPAGGGETQITTKVTPAPGVDEANLRADIYLDCDPSADGPIYLVGVAVKPAFWDTASAWFDGRFDPSLACAGGVISVVANDGFLRSTPFVPASNAVVVSQQKAPVASTYAPIDESTFLQYANVPLDGSGKDPEDGQLTGSRLSWHVVGPLPGSVVNITRTGTATVPGTHFDLNPPLGTGWPSGRYDVTLTTTDSTGRTSTSVSQFNIVGDADNDGIPTPTDTANCLVGGANRDNDPTNAFGDCDGDGIPNGADSAPATPATSYQGTATFDPQSLNPRSSGNPVSVYLTIQSRDMRKLTSSSLRMARINGIDPTDNSPHASGTCAMTAAKAKATAYSATETLATIRFDRQALNPWLVCMGILNQTIELKVAGSATNPAYTFEAIALVNVKS